MSSELASSAVTRIHRDLLDHLSSLDQLGERAAAAHLAAAIDALEDRLDSTETGIAGHRRHDPVEAMARGLIARFDERAAEAARRQIQAASGQVLLLWAAVADRIDAILAIRSARS